MGKNVGEVSINLAKAVGHSVLDYIWIARKEHPSTLHMNEKLQ